MKEAQNLLKYELLSEKISRMKHFALIFKAKKQKKNKLFVSFGTRNGKQKVASSWALPKIPLSNIPRNYFYHL